MSDNKQKTEISYQVNVQDLPYLGTRNNLNAKMYPKQYETNNGRSQTVPNQTMPLKEILARYAKGQPLPTAGEPRYSEFDEIALAKLDISERHNLKKSLEAQISDAKQKLSQPTKQQRKAQETTLESSTDASNEKPQ